MLKKFLQSKTQWKLDGNASYLVVGGLGGLGRAICKWLVSKGARYLIAPSRSGLSSAASSATAQELWSQGIILATPVCDATSLSALSAVLEACAESMPPIRGCINAAMALQVSLLNYSPGYACVPVRDLLLTLIKDSIFESMSYAQWDLTIRSKVQTSWNLHELFSDPLDFFILLSSVSGLYGSISQSNYAAGCTFQDALARFRSARGERAISLDIGWMKTIGIIAEREDYQRNRKRARDMVPIEEDEFLALLDLCCDPSGRYRVPVTEESQVLIGATTPAFFLSRGETPIPQVQCRMFSGLKGILKAKTRSPSYNVKEEHAALFKQASGPKERTRVVTDALVKKLARSLSVPLDYIDTEKALSNYGVDSLMAVELRNWFSNDFQAQVAVFNILENMPITRLGELVVTKSELA